MNLNKSLYIILVLLLNIFLLSGCDENNANRQEVLSQVENDFYDSVKNITWYKEKMQHAFDKIQETEAAIKYIGTSLQCAPDDNQSAIHALSSAVLDLKNDLDSHTKEYMQYSYKYKSAQFIISNYKEGGCLKDMLEMDAIEIVELKN